MILLLIGATVLLAPCDDNHVPAAMNAAASTWLDSLDFYAKYRYEHTIVSGDESFSASGAGEVVFCKNAFRTSVIWDKLKIDDSRDTAPFPSFDFSSFNGLDVHQSMRGRSLRSLGVSLPDLSKTVLLGDRVTVATSNGISISSRFPISSVPNPLGFIGGWNGGVVFGGLQLSPNTANRHRLIFSRNGLSNDNGFQMFITNPKKNVIEISINEEFDEETTFCRSLVFKVIEGIPLRTEEHFKRFSNAALASSKDISIDDFFILDGVPVPTGLIVEQDAMGVRKRSEFSFEPLSIRKSKIEDFDQETKDSGLGDKNGVFNILKCDVELLKAKVSKTNQGF